MARIEYSLANLPPPEQILSDFLQAGGNLKSFLEAHILDEKERKIAAIQILAKLESSSTDIKQSFERIRRHGALIESMLVEDELLELARQRGGKERMQAIKLLLDRLKHKEKMGEAVDEESILDKLLEQLNVKG